MTLSERLLRYLKNQYPSWIPSGDIQRIVAQETDYTPQNAMRRCREMAQEGTLEVKYINNHAHYKYKLPVIYQPLAYKD